MARLVALIIAAAAAAAAEETIAVAPTQPVLDAQLGRLTSQVHCLLGHKDACQQATVASPLPAVSPPPAKPSPPPPSTPPPFPPDETLECNCGRFSSCFNHYGGNMAADMMYTGQGTEVANSAAWKACYAAYAKCTAKVCNGALDTQKLPDATRRGRYVASGDAAASLPLRCCCCRCCPSCSCHTC